MPSSKKPDAFRRATTALLLATLFVIPLCGQTHTKPGRILKGTSLEWNRENAAHLMRRAGFSALPEELEAIVQQGFEVTLDRLLNPESVEDDHIDQFETATRSPNGFNYDTGGLNDPRVDVRGYQDLFLYRMAFSKRQLFEKMSFFWHDHFATSAEGVPQTTNDTQTPLIGNQYELIRTHAMGNFKDFVHAMSHDAAILEWLDQPFNVKEHPNENWARELLELFTIGIGNYTDQDVVEAARAFTGWTFSFDDGKFLFRETVHDFGQKTFMGVTGDFNGDDIIEIIFQRDETARFISRKLWEFFVYPDPSEEVIDALGDVFRDSGYAIRPLLRAIFEHPEFFSDRARRAVVKSPAEVVANFMRETGAIPTRAVTAEVHLAFMEEANQSLFVPPDVAGWPSGLLWLNPATMLSRYNLFGSSVAFRDTVLVGEDLDLPVHRFPPWLIDALTDHQLETADDLIFHFTERFLQGEISADARLALEEYMASGPDGLPQAFDISDRDADVKIRGLLFLILTMPEYQMN